jgi:rubrerythrin
MSGPWSFAEAREACRDASKAQQNVERDLVEAFRDYAEAERRYREALAKEIVRVHAEDGIAWSTAPDIARGNPTVARLRAERDISEGLKEAIVQAAWRRNADRKDAQRFSDWSQRRELAEFHGEDPDPPRNLTPLRAA